MRKLILTLLILCSIFSLALNSCSSESELVKDEDQDFKVSTYTLTIDGVKATEFLGEIIVCPDGYFMISGKAPDGSNLSIQTSKIFVNETRAFCDARYLEEDPYNNCIENAGFSITGLFMGEIYHAASGTATRTSTNDINISGSVWYMNDPLVVHGFTLEATASLVSPINCE